MPSTVSVVIPLFNGLPYVQQALDSVLTQTTPVDEIVIVDGGSTDGSLEWLRQLELPNLTREELPAGTTAAQNWTRCTQLATGDYVKLLCQDDFLHPQALEWQIADLDNFPECNMAIAQRDIVNARGETIARARGCQGLKPGPVSGKDAIRISSIKGTNIFGEPVTTLFRRQPMQSALPWLDDKPYVLDIFFDTAVVINSCLVVRKASVGAFRVSSSSWSTHLAKVQRKQFRLWQEHAATVSGPLSMWDQVVASSNLLIQSSLRRIAYAYLNIRKTLDHR